MIKASTPTAKEIRILAFGDSLTAGYRLKPEESYPAQLESLLNQSGFKVKVTNAGVSGETSYQGLKRIDWNINMGGPYDWVLVCLGANDGLRQLDLKQLSNNLENILLKIKKSGARPVIMAMKLPTNFEKTYRSEFEKIFPYLSKKLSIPLIPFLLEGVALDTKLNLEDQLHPNAEGQKIIAQKLSNFLKAKL